MVTDGCFHADQSSIVAVLREKQMNSGTLRSMNWESGGWTAPWAFQYPESCKMMKMNAAVKMGKMIPLILIVCLSVACLQAEPQVVYREIFPNDRETNASLPDSGWMAYGGSNGTEIPFGANMALSSQKGFPAALEPVNSIPCNTEMAKGYLYANATTIFPQLVWTDEVNVEMQKDRNLEVSWYQSTDACDPVHLALLVDGVWHMSAEPFAQDSKYAQKSLDVSKAGWLALNFVKDGELSPGPAKALMGAHLQGVGFFIPHPTGKIRLDTVEIKTGVEAGAKNHTMGEQSAESESLLKGFAFPPVNFHPGEEYGPAVRKYQGIPTIARAPGGQLWASWYAGPIWEDQFNYVVAATSADDGKTWSDICLVIDPDGEGPKRVADPCLWLDPDGKLWLFWWLNGDGLTVTMAMTTANPDAAVPVWSKPRALFEGVMLNKPVVTSRGEWLMPTAIWNRDGSCRVMVSEDRGKTWALRGSANVPVKRRNCDEPMLVERKDGSFWMLVRTSDFGISESISTDGGRKWSEAKDYLPNSTSRFYLGRLKSGHLLLIKHGGTKERLPGRNNLKAYLSDDDGVTWKGGLLIDARDSVSYPDATQSPDGTIYVIYDWNRGTEKQILMTTFTEEDVLGGTYASNVARSKVLVNQAFGINPMVGHEGSGPGLREDKNAAPLKERPGSKFATEEGEVRTLDASIKLFSDKDWLLHSLPRPFFYGKKFVFSSPGHTSAVCLEPGMAYVFTPTKDRNARSIEEELVACGFEKTSEKEFFLIVRRDQKAQLGDACSVYQKQVRAGERIQLGNWGILAF